jgi:dinuclear metal center YbgI/SA1388 family protein
MQLTALTEYLDELLEPSRYKDYAPNGLQVEGRAEVSRIVCGVTASQALLDAAVALHADAVLVHHGYFWKGEDSRVVGMKRRRLRTLLSHDINLLAYHLPLDGHRELGNNAQLARVLDFRPQGQAVEQELLWYGQVATPLPAGRWSDFLSERLGRKALLLGDPERMISRVAWCTGGAQGMFDAAIALGVDAFVTGEASEQNQHMAMESGCVFVAAGHHATERYGIEALGQKIANDLGMDVEYLDLDNPI